MKENTESNTGEESPRKAKLFLCCILAIVAAPSVLCLRPDPYPGLFYVVNGFLTTEWTVAGTALFFDITAKWLHPYKIRKDYNASHELIESSVWERIWKLRTEWITYTIVWNLSRMTFQSQYPGVLPSILQVAGLCVCLDAYVYGVHTWMHTRQGHLCHKKHHSFRHVNCWFVDHESPLESLIIGLGKHGLLAFVSPHPYVALEYLFATKFWSAVSHCGYNLPLFAFVDTYLPFMATPNRHEQHHYHFDPNLSIFTTVFDYAGNTLVWTEAEAVEWRRKRKQNAAARGKDQVVAWNVDPAASKQVDSQ